MEPVDEQMYEVGIDIHGAKEGPRLGWLSVLNKLVELCYIENLYPQTKTSTFLIYSVELSDKSDPAKKNVIVERRRLDAEALASSSGAKVANNIYVVYIRFVILRHE